MINDRDHKRSLSNSMPKPVKAIYFAVNLFGNVVINKIPIRHVRKWFYILMGCKIGKNSGLSRRVEVSYPKALVLGDNVSVGWFSNIDSRGGVRIGNNVNISSYVKIITGSHDIDDPKFTADFRPIVIKDNVWIGTAAILLQNVTIGEGSVVAAGAVVTKDIPPYEVWGGCPAKYIRKRNCEGSIDYKVGKPRFLY